MVNLVINQTAFNTEREVVQNERRYRNENSPDGLMDQELYNLAFQRHPYHWPVIGYQEDLEKMSNEAAVEFYRNFYSPNHATIIVVGDVDADNVRSIVQKYYGQLAPQNGTPAPVPSEPPQTAARAKELKLNIQVEKLLMGYHIPGIKNDDMATLDVLQNILTGGKSSRLNRALVETGLVTVVESSELEEKDPSLFVIGANLQRNKRASAVEKIILKELDRLRKVPVTDKELTRAKNKINFGFYEGLGSNFQRAYFLGRYEAAAGDFTQGIKHQQQVQSVTAEDILNAAKKYFDPKNRTVITGVQK